MAAVFENFDTYKEKQLLDQGRARKKYNLEIIYAGFREYIEERIPIVNNRLSSKYNRFWE